MGSQLRRIARPGALILIFVIGGGYISGREVVEFAGEYGAIGLVSVVSIAVGFGVLTVPVFEFVRRFETTTYLAFIKELLGRWWPAFDLAFLVTALFLIGVVVSFAGILLTRLLNVFVNVQPPPLIAGYHYGHLVLGMVIVGTITLEEWSEEGFIDRFDLLGSVAIVVVLLSFTALTFVDVVTTGGVRITPSPEWDNVSAVLAGTTDQYCRTADRCRQSIPTVLIDGLVYVGIHIPVYPLIVGQLYDETTGEFQLKTPAESVAAGLLAGVLFTTPFALTFLVQMGFYPDPTVVGGEQAVPWLPVLQRVAGPWAIGVYAAIAAWAFLATTTALTETILERSEELLDSTAGLRFDAFGRTRTTAVVTVLTLVAGFAISQIGLIRLIFDFYPLLTLVYVVVFVLPLAVWGVPRLLR